MTEKISIEQWKKLLTFVYQNEHSSFYREKFQSVGFNPETDFQTHRDITNIPLTTKAELLQAGSDKLAFVPENKITGISATSGTTGSPFITFRSPSDTPAHPHGIKDIGRTMILFGPINGSAMLHFFNQRDEMAFVGDIYNLSNSIEVAAQAGTNSLLTTPTIAIILRKHLEKNPSLFSTLRNIRLAGEPVSLAKRDFIKSLYPHQRIYSLYGMNEVGGISTQCLPLLDRSDGMFFHPDFNQTEFETLDPKTEQPAKEGAFGEIVITDFTSLGTPFIRYRTGDVGALIESDCTCGISGKLLSVVGRVTHDSVKAGGFVFSSSMFNHAIDNLHKFISPHFSIKVAEKFSSSNILISLEITVMLNNEIPASKINDVKEVIASTIAAKTRLSTSRTLQDAISENLCEPLKISFDSFKTISGKRNSSINLII